MENNQPHRRPEEEAARLHPVPALLTLFLLQRFSKLISKVQARESEPLYYLWKRILVLLVPKMTDEELGTFLDDTTLLRAVHYFDAEAKNLLLLLKTRSVPQALLEMLALNTRTTEHTWGTASIDVTLLHDGHGTLNDALLLTHWLDCLAQSLPRELAALSSEEFRNRFEILDEIFGQRMIQLVSEFQAPEIKFKYLEYTLQFYGWFCTALQRQFDSDVCLIVLERMTTSIELVYGVNRLIGALPRYSQKISTARGLLKNQLRIEAGTERLSMSIFYLLLEADGKRQMDCLSVYCSTTFQFFGTIANEAVTILGRPPTDFDVIALGSWSLEQSIPGSDLEYIILLSQPMQPDFAGYFEKFVKIFNRAINSLNTVYVDNQLRPVVYEQDKFENLSSIMEYQKLWNTALAHTRPKLPFANELFSMLSTKSIFRSSATFDGLKDFRNALHEFQQLNASALKKYAFRKIEHDVDILLKKRRYDYQFNTYLLMILAILDNIKVMNLEVHEILDALVQKGRLTPAFASLYHEVREEQRLDRAKSKLQELPDGKTVQIVNHLKLINANLEPINNSTLLHVYQRLLYFVQSYEGSDATYERLFQSLVLLQNCHGPDGGELYDSASTAAKEFSRIMFGALLVNVPLDPAQDKKTLSYYIDNNIQVPFCQDDTQFAIQLTLSLLLNAEVDANGVLVSNAGVAIFELKSPLSFKKRSHNVLLLLPEMHKTLPVKFIEMINNLHVCNLFDCWIRSSVIYHFGLNSQSLDLMFWASANLKDFIGRVIPTQHKLTYWTIVDIIYQTYNFEKHFSFALRSRNITLKQRLAEMNDEITPTISEYHREDSAVMKKRLDQLAESYKVRYSPAVLPKGDACDQILKNAIWNDYTQPHLHRALQQPVTALSFGPIHNVEPNVACGYMAQAIQLCTNRLQTLILPNIPLTDACVRAISHCKRLRHLTTCMTQQQMQSVLEIKSLTELEMYSYETIQSTFLVKWLLCRQIKFIGLMKCQKADICNYLLYNVKATDLSNLPLVYCNIEQFLPEAQNGILDLSLFNIQFLKAMPPLNAKAAIFRMNQTMQQLFELCTTNQTLEAIEMPSLSEDLSYGYCNVTKNIQSTNTCLILPNGEEALILEKSVQIGNKTPITNNDNCVIVWKVFLMPNDLLCLVFTSKANEDEFQILFFNWDRHTYLHSTPITERFVYAVKPLEDSILVAYRSGLMSKIQVETKVKTTWQCGRVAQDIIAVSPDTHRFATFSPLDKLYKVFSSSSGRLLYTKVADSEEWRHQQPLSIVLLSAQDTLKVKEFKRYKKDGEFSVAASSAESLCHLMNLLHMNFTIDCPSPLEKSPHHFLYNPELIVPTVCTSAIVGKDKFVLGMSDGSIVYAYLEQNTIKVTHKEKCHNSAIDSFAVLETINNHYLVSVSRDGSVVLWNIGPKEITKLLVYQHKSKRQIYARWIRSGGGYNILVIPLSEGERVLNFLDLHLSETGTVTLPALSLQDCYITHLVSFGMKYIYCTQKAIYFHNRAVNPVQTHSVVQLPCPVSSIALLHDQDNQTPNFAYSTHDSNIYYATTRAVLSTVQTPHLQPITSIIKIDSWRVISGSLCGQVCLSSVNSSQMLINIQKPIISMQYLNQCLTMVTSDGWLYIYAFDADTEQINCQGSSCLHNEFELMIEPIEANGLKQKISTLNGDIRKRFLNVLNAANIQVDFVDQGISHVPEDRSPTQSQKLTQKNMFSQIFGAVVQFLSPKNNGFRDDEQWAEKIVIPDDRF